MNPSSLQHKTIRPGSLGTYNYYHSNRQPLPAAKPAVKRPRPASGLRRKITVSLFVLVALIGLPLLRPFGGNAPVTGDTPTINPQAAASVAAVTKPSGPCAANQLDKFIVVSIGQRHLWACQGSKQVYDTPVITGITTHADTTTPPGTYHIASKQTDTTLTGSDSTGSWNDPVSYWMPFLTNEHGTYGFHDATWRGGSEFGNIDSSSDQASHGCVELPIAASHWLYDWSVKGTTVTIET